MGAIIDSELKTFFTANVDGLVDGIGRAKKEIADYKKSLTATKGNVLNPFAAIGSSLTGISAKLGVSGRAAGVLAAEGALFVKTLTAASSLAGETADRFHGVSESLRQNSKVNMFASSVDGLDSLRSKLEATNSLIKDARKTVQDSDQFGLRENGVGKFQGSVSTMVYGALNAVGIGSYTNFEREDDERKQLEGQAELAQRQRAKLVKQYGLEQRNQVGLTDERLQGSGPGLRIAELERGRARELNSLKGTDLYTRDNRRAIQARYKEEIRAEKELLTVSDQRFRRDAGNLGTERSLRTEEAKRQAIAERNLAGLREELGTHAHMNQEARRALDLDIIRSETEVRNARMENDLAQSRQSLLQKNTLVQGTNASAVAKQYQAEMNTLSALKEQLAVVKDINGTKAQGLGISIAESENAIRQTRQDQLYGKSPSAIQKHIADMRKDRINRDRFDQQQARVDGLIDVHRGASGNIIDGLDPITGERRAPRSGFQQPPTGLQSGHVGDRTSLNGSRGAFDTDPGGGLHGEGTTPAPFGESTASRLLRDAPSAEKILAGMRGDPARDPAARLAAKSVFGDRSTLAGVRSVLTAGDRKAANSAHALMSASVEKFGAPSTLSQAAVQLSAKKLLQEQATTAAVQRVEAAVRALNVGFQ